MTQEQKQEKKVEWKFPGHFGTIPSFLAECSTYQKIMIVTKSYDGGYTIVSGWMLAPGVVVAESKPTTHGFFKTDDARHLIHTASILLTI